MNEHEIWRSFKGGESAQAIASRLNLGRGTILKIVLYIEADRATSRFFDMQYDEEGCPDPVPQRPQIPADLDKLENWLWR